MFLANNHFFSRTWSNHLTLVMLLPALMWLFTNSHINRHSHRLPNGIVIQHAHPFQPAGNHLPFQTHSHADREIAFFDQISAINTLLIVTLGLIILLTAINYESIRFTLKLKIISQKTIHRLRPPPFLHQL